MAHTPSARGRMLGAELKRLRDARGLTKGRCRLYEPVRILGLPRGGRQDPVSWAEIAALCDFLGASGPEKDRLVNLARESETQGWWTDYADVFTGGFRFIRGRSVLYQDLSR